MSLIDEIFAHPELRERPPVLVDIGASGEVHRKWKPFARHAVCIAFDADDREMRYTVSQGSAFRKLIICNRIVVEDEGTGAGAFHLTRSPYCSSRLRPRTDRLEDWSFSPLFAVERSVDLPVTTLSRALADNGLVGVDWFKTDSQGTDLRLWKSLPREVSGRALVAEFEPGIIDAYEGEDKLSDVMACMQAEDFWLSSLVVKGSRRLSAATLARHFPGFFGKVVGRAQRPSPGWGEVTYLNSLRDPGSWSRREFLLGWVFASCEGQHGFAFELAERAAAHFGDPLLAAMRERSRGRLRRGAIVSACAALPWEAVRRLAGMERR
jgi:hypothetical protein